MDHPKVTVAIPSRDFVHTSFAFSLISMITATRFPVFIANVRSSILPVSRSFLVEQAQNNKSDYILFLDSDMVFPPDTLMRLLSHDKDITAGIYCQREGDRKPMGCVPGMAAIDILSKEGLTEAWRVPTGCLLIKMSVFSQMEKPYFRWKIREDSSHIVGEDSEFCDRARELGYEIWIDNALSHSIGHIGEVTRFID